MGPSKCLPSTSLNYGSSEASSKESASLLPTAFFRTNTTLPTAVALKRFAALPDYKDTLDMRKHVNSIYGLAFVPVANVLRTCEDLKNLLTLLYPQVIGLVITYYESTWLYGDDPLQLWIVHTLHGDPRTIYKQLR